MSSNMERRFYPDWTDVIRWLKHFLHPQFLFIDERYKPKTLSPFSIFTVSEKRNRESAKMVADKSKKLKVSEKEETEIDGELVLSIEKLQEMQDELEKVNEEASDKVLEIEQKYNEIRKPIYDKRNEIIKSIPDFWLTAFLSHPALGDLLNDEDQKIFKYLSSLEVEDSKDVKSGYSITFNFNPNPYFDDTKLVKAFTFLEEGTTKVTATPIKWKEGKDITNGVNHEKKGSKRAPIDISFFSWFSDTEQKDDLDDIHDEVAELIKDDLWPSPLTYFNNEEPDEEDGDEDEAADEDGDDSEDDDAQEDDDEGEDGGN
ncbi:PREDICTED: NAP1-related protein 2-like isoform X2 [Lupinus angustifolius]|uniref:NAP1-related protein 2-like isoform X2 n=1 Tax=Lupinus angustifolius TaxID=3871 RepID=UPI00092EBEBD|nr:PREDICTED: NAP1-related protein 2-like isoform X2 [Lupinus angustifolius]